jgi:DNA-directed RNA polymerase omega subunit
MYSFELEKMLDKSEGSVYKLVVLAAKRALELAEGQPRLVSESDSSIKPSIIALHEIAQNKIKAKKSKGE